MPNISKEQIEQSICAARIGQQLNDDRENELHQDEKAVIADAIDMLQGLLAQPEQMPVNNAFLTTPEMAAFSRFLETCEDGEGYDVPKSMMHRLAQIGVVRHLSRGIYNITEFGQSVIDTAPVAPIGADDVTDEMLAIYFDDDSMEWQNIPYPLVIAAKKSCAGIINAWGAKK